MLTLTIVGVVASVTIPSLIQTSTENSYKTKFKSFYSDFAQAHKTAVAEGNNARGDLAEHGIFGYFKYLKYCSGPGGNGTDCWHDVGVVKNLCGDSSNTNAYTYYHNIMLQNGMLLVMFNDLNPERRYLVDVNGFDGPNTIGKDIFSVMLDENRAYPEGSDRGGTCDPSCSDANRTSGMACGQYIMLGQDY